jgi:hypothetical protein
MIVRSEILDQFQQVADEQGMPLGPLSDELSLLDLGLDSMCIVIIVRRLETVLGVDPFNQNEDVPFPLNLREFIRLYENAVQQLPSSAGCH